jgi:hypothetical protein
MDDLDDEFFVYRTLAELSRQARSRALAAPHDSYVANIYVAGLMKKTSDRKSAIESHFERLDRALFDQFLVRLVATFERCAFVQLRTALGEARTTLQRHYNSRHPFSRAAQHLVKDAEDFWNLSGIEALLASYPQAACKDLQVLREHRNYVTHGGRVGKLSRYAKIDEVHSTLRELLQVINTNDPEVQE